MGCGCGCPDRPVEDYSKCRDCGQIHRICCLKLTGKGQTWYLRAANSPPAWDELGFESETDPGYVAYITIWNNSWSRYYFDGDSCDLTQGVQGSGSSNLCGGLTSVNPCSFYGERIDPSEWPYEPYYYDPFGARITIGYRQSVKWEVADDCSEVKLTLYWTDRTGYGTFATTRYTQTLPVDWIGSGLPIEWTVGEDTITLAECEAGEPPAPTTLICCWQATVVTPSSTRAVKSKKAADSAVCEEGHPRGLDAWSDTPSTDQCCKGITIARDVTTEAFAGTRIVLWYEVSPDYSYVRVQVRGSDETNSYQWNTYQDVAYTPDWYLTPIVFPATTANPGLNPFDATLTLSQCGYVVRPCESIDCFPPCISNTLDCDGVTPTHSLLFLDIDAPGACFDGVWMMQYTGGNEYNLYVPPGTGTFGSDHIGTGTTECPLIEYFRLWCDGEGGFTLSYKFTVFDGGSNTGSQSVSVACVDGEIVDISISLELSFGSGVFTIFSNNRGLR